MNRKQFVLILLALAIIGGCGLMLFTRNKKDWAAKEAKVGDKVLPDFRMNDVATIHIKGYTEFNVVRSNGVWRVPERNNYQANYAIVSDLLFKIRDLKVVQSDLVGPSLLPRVMLDEEHRTFVEFKGPQGKVMDTLLVGRKHDRPQKDNEPLGIHGFFDGRYVLLPADTGNVLLTSDELGSIIPVPGPWLDPSFFKVTNVKFISLVSTNPADSWSLTKESKGAPWTLSDLKSGETLNMARVYQTVEMMEFPRFSDAFPNVPPYSTNWGLDHPLVATIMTDQLAYTVKIGTRDENETYHITVSVTGDLNAPRVPAADETPAEKEQRDEEYQTTLKDARDKLAKGQELSKWVYEADSWLDVIARPRSKFTEASPPPN